MLEIRVVVRGSGHVAAALVVSRRSATSLHGQAESLRCHPQVWAAMCAGRLDPARGRVLAGALALVPEADADGVARADGDVAADRARVFGAGLGYARDHTARQPARRGMNCLTPSSVPTQSSVPAAGRPPRAVGSGTREWLAGGMDGLDLADLLTPRRTADPGSFVIDVPDGLQQGRGAWGGVATGAMTAAAELVDTRPGLAVRTVSAQLVAPLLVGRATIGVEVLRTGSATSTVAARVVDGEGRLVAHGVVVSGAARRGEGMPDGPGWLGVEPPPELDAGPDAVPVVDVGPPLVPDFATHLQYRPIEGLPFSGATSDLTTGWVAPRAPVGRVDAAVVVALADAWWVSVMAMMDRQRPAATVGFTVDLPGDPARLLRDVHGRLEPLFHRGRIVAARDGYAVEIRELWTRRGELLTWNTQTVAVIA